VLDLYHWLGGLYGRFGLAAKIGLAVGLSLVTTVAGVAIVVWLPADHFCHRGAGARRRHPVVRWALLVLKNAAGLLVLPLAVVTLIGPGPGILFSLIALSLLDFPGKHALERKLLSRPGVIRSINGLRARWGRPPLVVELP
jgi:hypothetical protein